MINAIEYHFQVRWGETDAAGIVFYPSFYAWMDEATHHYFKQIGFPTTKLFEDEKVGPPLVEAKCQFKKPLLFGDQVTVASVVSEVRNKVFIINHTFSRNSEIVAEGYEIRVWADFNASKVKAVPISDELRERLLSAKAAI